MKIIFLSYSLIYLISILICLLPIIIFYGNNTYKIEKNNIKTDVKIMLIPVLNSLIAYSILSEYFNSFLDKLKEATIDSHFNTR